MNAGQMHVYTSQVRSSPRREDSNFFYNLRGILIILVVLGHVLEQFYFSNTAARFIYKEIYFFHMPMFIILVGYFSSTSVRLVNLVQSLIYPYVIMQVVYAVSDHALFGAEILESLLRPNWGMWFLLCLFVWRAIWPFVCNLPYLLTVAVLSAIACGYVEGLDRTMSRIIVFFPFFVIGCRWSEIGGREQAHEWLRSHGLGIFLAGILAQGIFLGADFAPAWLYGKLSYTSLGEPYLWAGGIRLLALMAAGVGILLCIGMVTTRSNWLTRVGKCSLVIYMMHFILIDLLRASNIPTQITSTLHNHWAIVFVISPVLAMAAVAFLSLPVIQISSEYIFKPHRRWRISK